MSDSNPRALLERISLIVYDADIFNCSRQCEQSRSAGQSLDQTPPPYVNYPPSPIWTIGEAALADEAGALPIAYPAGTGLPQDAASAGLRAQPTCRFTSDERFTYRFHTNWRSH